SALLCDDLAEMEDRPWRALPAGRGNEPKPITQNRLASMLKDFQIVSHTIRPASGTTAKGYERKDFEDTWLRYPPPPESATEDSAPTDPPTSQPTPSIFEKPSDFDVPKRNSVTTQRPVGESAIFQGVTETICDGSQNGTSPNAEKGCDG